MTMTIPAQITGALSENLLTLLAYSDEYGKLVAGTVDPQLFEGEMRIMAERIIDYWRIHHEAPKMHTADLFADILEDPHNRRAATYKRTLHGMIQLAQGINAQYVLSQMKTFTRMQRLKDAVLRSAEKLNQPTETTIEDVEVIMSDILHARDFMYEPGLTFDSFDVVLEHMKKHYNEFSTGIPLFDFYNIVPARGTLFLLLGGSGVGKTWGMVHLGKRALMQQKKVLHITPEISGEGTLLRYYMAMFAAAKRSDKIKSTMIERDHGRLTGFWREKAEPNFDFESYSVRDELLTHVTKISERIGELRVLRVAPRSMTVDALNGYLDTLEAAENFVPDLLIADSAYLLKAEALKEYRHALGRLYERIRAIGVDRNMAVAASHQLSKLGAQAKRAKHIHVAEDWSIIQTADIAVTHSSTKQEQRFGLARLYADKVRSDKGDMGVLITQNYDLGQYLLDSIRMPASYWDQFEDEFGSDEEPEDQDADEMEPE
jgi:hypothetical protein